MSQQYELTELADQDIFEVSIYIAQDRGVAASQRFIDTINQKFQLLADSPQLGRRRPELAPELRSFPSGNYIIFYRSTTEGILIIRVIHGARDINSIFAEENNNE